MRLDEYQKLASSTAIYPGRNSLMGLIYCTLKLNGEAGEIAEKVGKALRDDNGIINEKRRELLVSELGDVCWYIANLAEELGISLEEVAKKNIEKLLDRKIRNVLHGDGDNR